MQLSMSEKLQRNLGKVSLSAEDPNSLFEEIKAMILDDGFIPGDVLPSEAKLCERFSVSRGSVREALKRLQTLGLVEIRRGIGTYVGPFSVEPLMEAIMLGTAVRARVNPDAYTELLETRIAVDMGMAVPICETFKGQSAENLHKIVDLMFVAAEKGERFKALDQQFHYEMQSAVGNGFALDLVSGFWDLFAKIRLDELVQSKWSQLAVAQTHRDLLLTAQAGDVKAYRKALVVHYANSRDQAQKFSAAALSSSVN